MKGKKRKKEKKMNHWTELILSCSMICLNPFSGDRTHCTTSAACWVRLVCIVLILLLIPLAICQYIYNTIYEWCWGPLEDKVNYICPSHIYSEVHSLPSILNVFFLNAGCLPNWVSPVNDMRPCIHRIQEVCQVIRQRQPHVCCFVEMMDKQAIEYMKKALVHDYPYQMYNIGGNHWMKLPSGYAILSKYPFFQKEVSFEPFSDSIGSDAWANKGIVTVPIHVSVQYQFDITMVHFQSDSEGNQSLIRAQQWKQLDRWMANKTTTAQFEMVVGDLNWTPSEYYHFYKQNSPLWFDCNINNIIKGDRTFYQIQSKTNSSTDWGNKNWNQKIDPSSYLDYVFLYKREATRSSCPSFFYLQVLPYEGKEKSSYSDHLAIQCFFWIGPR
jgi:exonuclease III